VTEDRHLTPAETDLCRSVFGAAIDYEKVRVANRKWIFFQPKKTIMAPMGTIHYHPQGERYCDDFGHADVDSQGYFIHEMVHVWQFQKGIFLPVKRHPFCTYRYAFQPGLAFVRYGLEQQGEIVRHAFLLRHNRLIPGAPSLAQYESLIPFARQAAGHA
jgi:hypothetical protein